MGFKFTAQHIILQSLFVSKHLGLMNASVEIVARTWEHRCPNYFIFDLNGVSRGRFFFFPKFCKELRHMWSWSVSIWLYLCKRPLSFSTPDNFKCVFKHSQTQIWQRSRNPKEVLTSHMKIGSWVKKDNLNYTGNGVSQWLLWTCQLPGGHSAAPSMLFICTYS